MALASTPCHTLLSPDGIGLQSAAFMKMLLPRHSHACGGYAAVAKAELSHRLLNLLHIRCQLPGFSARFYRQLNFEGCEFFAQFLVSGAEDLDGQQTGITPPADGDGGNWNA